MRIEAVAATVLVVVGLATASDGAGRRSRWYEGSCGEEDWDLKTASDASARLIDPVLRETTIADLNAIPRAPRFGWGRAQGIETTTWKLTNVRLLEVRVESDQDYHLVLGQGQWTIIAELPSPGCVPPTSTVRDSVAKARLHIDAALSHGGGFSNVVTLAGIGFFDRDHGQRGAAWNQVELHPITAICFGKDCDLAAPGGVAGVRQAVPPESQEQIERNAERQAQEHDAHNTCAQAAAARQAVQEYRNFLAACRSWGNLVGHDCSEKSHERLASEVQAAVMDENNRENEFLRKWGAEAFVGINCNE